MPPQARKTSNSVTGCPDCNCPDRFTGSDDCLDEIIDYKKADCFGFKQLVVNAICAVKDIAAAIREYVTSQPVVVAQGPLHFNIADYGDLTNGNCIDVELFVANFDMEIIGIGVSYLGAFPVQGVYNNDDKLNIQFYNETTNAQLGDTLQLHNTKKHDEQSAAGEVISANLGQGETAMLRVCYEDTEGSTFPAKAFDFFLWVRPLQLQNP